MEMTRWIKFRERGRDAQFEMHFQPTCVVRGDLTVVSSEVSFCAVADTLSPKGSLTPATGGVILKGLSWLQVKRDLMPLHFPPQTQCCFSCFEMAIA